jgi:ATP-dependent helicase YprA (DUF1998 family)
MLDPIGASERLREFVISYLDTAFRLKRSDLAEKRRGLLREIGTLMTEPYIEPVPRYEAAAYPIEGLVDLKEDNPIGHLTEAARVAFADLALSGLFPGEDAESGKTKRKSKAHIRPYRHQMEMLRRGTRAGMPGAVTSGTGSGKTESFMLPVFASITAEAVHWPKPSADFLKSEGWWVDPEATTFTPHRSGEANGRPKAVRALLLYPMNALVEDQMTRLRKSLNSDTARAVMDERFEGNRIFFGRYTSATPVTGFRVHPRRGNDPKEVERQTNRTERLAKQLTEIEDMQNQARRFDERESMEARIGNRVAQEGTRFMFPSTDGSELVTRWDMQITPPDILVTNVSMLSAMLSR